MGRRSDETSEGEKSVSEVLLFGGRWGRGNWLRKERKRGKDEEKVERIT